MTWGTFPGSYAATLRRGDTCFVDFASELRDRGLVARPGDVREAHFVYADEDSAGSAKVYVDLDLSPARLLPMQAVRPQHVYPTREAALEAQSRGAS